MSVTLTYAATMKTIETLEANASGASASGRRVTYEEFDESATLNATSTPPATRCAFFVLTLTAGAATVDLRALTGTNGVAVDGNGLKVQAVRVKNLGANTLTIKAGASNGHTGVFAATTGQVVQPGGHVQVYTNDAGDDIDATHKVWDITGTGTQTSEWSVVLG